MNKQNVLYPYNGILFSNKKGKKYWHMLQHGWTSRTLEASCKRLHIVWFHLYEIPRKRNLQKKADHWLPGAGGV